jgi:fructokinase
LRAAARAARQAHRKVALSLSDAFCVDRHRAAFLGLLADVDILFANEAEICSLFEANDFADAAAAARKTVPLAALTQSEAGSLILHGEETVRVAAEPTTLIDSTGAGDAYAAGFLAAYTHGRDLAACGRLGSLAAAEVISHYGARPVADIGFYLEKI